MERPTSFTDVAAPSAPGTAVRRHLLVAVGAFSIGLVLTVMQAIKLPYPEFFSSIPPWSYGRLRPMAVDLVIFGWITIVNVAAVYFLVPRLTGARLWSERLANLNLYLLVAAPLAGVVAVGLGAGEGREFLEFPLWVDAIMVSALVIPTVTATRALQERTEEGLYVSLLYVVGGLYWALLLIILGNLPGLNGVGSALQGAFFRNGLLGMWVTGVGVGTAYYLIPRLTERPLYSRPLALIGFWSLAFASAVAGPGQLVYGPAADWIETVGIAVTLTALVGALAVTTNFAATLGPAWDQVRSSLILKLIIGGTLFYVTSAFLTAASTFRTASAVVGFTLWSDGILTATIFGTASFFASAFVYHAVSREWGRVMFSEALGRRQIRFTGWGVAIGSTLLLGAGLRLGYTWVGGAFSSTPAVGDGFAASGKVFVTMGPLILIATVIFALGYLTFVYNVLRTITSGRADVREVISESAE